MTDAANRPSPTVCKHGIRWPHECRDCIHEEDLACLTDAEEFDGVTKRAIYSNPEEMYIMAIKDNSAGEGNMINTVRLTDANVSIGPMHWCNYCQQNVGGAIKHKAGCRALTDAEALALKLQHPERYGIEGPIVVTETIHITDEEMDRLLKAPPESVVIKSTIVKPSSESEG